MNYLLFDDQSWEQLLPLTFTRPVAEIRIGILTIREKWNLYLNTQCSFLTKDYLKTKYAAKVAENNILINGSILPETKLVEKISELEKNQALIKDNIIVAVNVGEFSNFNLENNFENFSKINYEYEISKINFTYEIFKKNGEAIQNDFELLTKNRKSQKLSKTNNILAAENIFLENGAKVEFATLNASSGPIYIGKDAKIMEGSIVRGPFALCEKSTLKMAAKIYGPTTIGPASKVGGEVNNSVFFGNAILKSSDEQFINKLIPEYKDNLAKLSIVKSIEINANLLKEIETSKWQIMFMEIMAELYEKINLLEEANDVYKTILQFEFLEQPLEIEMKIIQNLILLKN